MDQQPEKNEFEACEAVALAIKQAIRKTNLSRDQVVDAINDYFSRRFDGADADPCVCRKPLSLHMFNHYLSKPRQYPIPAYYLFAIHHITGSLLPAEVIIGPEGARVATADQIRQIAIGKLQEAIHEMRQRKQALLMNRN